jgi:hypothetical protein
MPQWRQTHFQHDSSKTCAKPPYTWSPDDRKPCDVVIVVGRVRLQVLTAPKVLFKRRASKSEAKRAPPAKSLSEQTCENGHAQSKVERFEVCLPSGGLSDKNLGHPNLNR